MPTIYFNHKLEGNETIWDASNGATRQNLFVINKMGKDFLLSEKVVCSVGFLDKGKHSFIFLNPPKGGDNRILGVFLCASYGYRLVKGKALYENSSVGGSGNSESKFGIYELGTILAEDSFWELTLEGWRKLGTDILLDEGEVTDV